MNSPSIAIDYSKTTPYQYNTTLNNLARWLALFGIFFIPLSSSLNNALSIAALLTLFSAGLSSRLNLAAKYKMNWLAVGLIIIFAFGVFISVHQSQLPLHDALRGFKKYAHKLLMLMLIMPLFINPKWRRHAFHSLIYGTLVTTLIYIYGMQYPDIFTSIFHKPAFLYISTIPLSIAAAYCWFYVTYQLFNERKHLVVYTLLAAWFFLFLFFYSPQRTGMLICLALLTILCCTLIESKKGIAIGVILTALVFSLTYLTSSTVHSRLNNAAREATTAIQQYNQLSPSTTRATYTSIGLRIAFAKYSLKLIKQKPLLGYGTGSFSTVYRTTGGPGLNAEMDTVGDPHNSYLHIAVENGLLGMIAFVAWLLVTLFEARHLPKTERHLAIGLVITFAIACVCVSGMLRNKIAMLYMAFVAVLYAARFDDTQDNLTSS